MPPSGIRITVIPTFRSIHGRFVKANKELLESHRDLMREQGRRMKGLAQDEAPKGKTGRFSRGIRFRTFVKQDAAGFSVSVPQPLGTFIIKGTKRHRISAKNANALFFLWNKIAAFALVPKGGSRHYWGKTRGGQRMLVIGKGYVDHPGTKADPFLSRAYRRWIPGARADLHRISTNYVRTILGAGVETAKFSQ